MPLTHLSNPAGSGTFTIQNPASASNRTLTYPDATGTVAITDDLLGVGQIWQDVTASRVASTSYQNNTSKPIVISIRVTGTSSPFQVSSDNVSFVSISASTSTAGVGGWIGGIVPKDHYYRMNGGGTINGWAELR